MMLTSMFGVSVTQARQGPTDRFAAGRYIVTFADEPVASYDGYEAGFAALGKHPAADLAVAHDLGVIIVRIAATQPDLL